MQKNHDRNQAVSTPRAPTPHRKGHRRPQTPTGGTNTPLERLRALTAEFSPATRSHYAHLLAGKAPIPRYALTVDDGGERDLMLGYSPQELAAFAQQSLTEKPPTTPVELVDLETGEQRPAVLSVFFAVGERVLPLLVGNIIDLDLSGREGDQNRNREREDELHHASQLIDAGSPVPAELFPAIADVVELDLEDRRHDAERDPAAEELLAEIHEQLLFRVPARNYAANAATGN